MNALEVFLICFGVVMAIGTILILVALFKFYITPIGGDFIIYTKGDADNDSLYKIDLEDHPLEWKGKSIRFRIIRK